MSIFVIADLHLSFKNPKPMDIFGDNWENHAEKVKEDWKKKVTENDVVVLPGDFSWETYLKDTIQDFTYLNNLPGKKILLKGNHDYWWTTITSMRKFLQENQFTNIDFLYNNSYEFENKIFTIKTLDEAYSFVFINEEVELSEISSTLFLKGVGNIFALLAQINGVSENDIYVRLYSQENLIGDEQYVSLVNQGGSYTLVLTGGTEPVRDLTVKIEFYISLYSFDGVDKTDFILYENTIVISQTNN